MFLAQGALGLISVFIAVSAGDRAGALRMLSTAVLAAASGVALLLYGGSGKRAAPGGIVLGQAALGLIFAIVFRAAGYTEDALLMFCGAAIIALFGVGLLLYRRK